MRNDLHWRRFRGAVRVLRNRIAAGYAADAARAARAERVREQVLVRRTITRWRPRLHGFGRL